MKGYLHTKASTSLDRLDENAMCAFEEGLKGL